MAIITLTLSTLGKIFRRPIEIFSYFSQKKIKPVFWEKKVKKKKSTITNVSSAKLAQEVVKVK